MPKIQTCAVCGKTFSNKKHPNQKVCSRECVFAQKRIGKTMISRTCPLCNKVFQFEKGRSDPMYCNRECANIAKINRITKQCEHCGIDFSIKPNRANSQKYCSLQCAGKAKEFEKAVRKCAHCGKEFEVNPCRISAKYCSTICKTTDSRTKKVERKCKQCNSVFYVFSKSKRIYCCISCAHKDSDQKVKCVCETCGVEFLRHNYMSSRRYCSQQCFKKTRKPTSIELKVKAILDELNIAYQEQVQLGTFICDFIVENSTVIEVDGTYWHSLPSAIERDARKDKCVSMHGYSILRLSEKQVNNDIIECITLIQKAINISEPLKINRQLSLFD